MTFAHPPRPPHSTRRTAGAGLTRASTSSIRATPTSTRSWSARSGATPRRRRCGPTTGRGRAWPGNCGGARCTARARAERCARRRLACGAWCVCAPGLAERQVLPACRPTWSAARRCRTDLLGDAAAPRHGAVGCTLAAAAAAAPHELWAAPLPRVKLTWRVVPCMRPRNDRACGRADRSPRRDVLGPPTICRRASLPGRWLDPPGGGRSPGGVREWQRVERWSPGVSAGCCRACRA